MTHAAKVRVLIVEDHRLFRDAMKALLKDEFEIVAETGEAANAVELASINKPDVVLLDLGMPGTSGVETAYRLIKATPASRVLIVTEHDEDEYVAECLRQAKVAGYLLKADSASELVKAIKEVHAGKIYLSNSIAPVVLRLLSDPNRPVGNDFGLTRREREILKRIGEGESTKSIAVRLNISPKTVQIHRGNLMAKLNVSSTALLMRRAIKHGLVQL